MLQAEDGIRDLVRSRGLGDVYKRQEWDGLTFEQIAARHPAKLARMRMDPAYPPPGGELSLIHI